MNSGSTPIDETPINVLPQTRPDTDSAGRAHLLIWGVSGGALLIAVGTALGTLLNVPVFGMRTPSGPSLGLSLLRSIGIGPLDWLACAVSSPLFVWLARRFPINRRQWKFSLPLHLGVATVLVLLVGLLFFGWIMPPPPRSSSGLLRYFLISHLFTGGPPFGVMIAAIHALEFYRRYQERELEATRLQAQLTASRLEALTAQLHPHFLFNTLQGISTLIYRDAKAADAMLTGLSDLLRLTLQRGNRHQIPLREELELLSLYVGICKERFKDRLVFETQVTAEAHHALVPFFILQPLVENAFQHGIARRSGTGHVAVSAERRGDTLQLSVQDDGPGIDDLEQPFPKDGIGLSNVQNRLRQLYGDRQQLTLETPPEGGLWATLVLPYNTAPVPEVEAS